MKTALGWLGAFAGLTLVSAAQTAIVAGGMLLAPAAFAQPPANTPDPNHPGKAIYDKTCAMCHANPAPGSRAAAFSQITGTSPAQLRETLTNGVMKPMAASLSPEDMTSLIGYLTSGQRTINANWTDSLMCPADDRTVDVTKPVAFGGFGVDPHSTRNLSAAKAGLKKADMAHLEIAWAVGFPQTQSLGTGAVVLGDTVFVNGAGKLLALDAAKGCARWVKALNSRNTPQIADLDGRKVLLLANGRNDLSMIDAKTGDTVWTVNAQPAHDEGIGIRGGVVAYKDKIIVPYSASGVGTGQNAKFECCTGHGAVVALALKDGHKLWEYHTMKDARNTPASCPRPASSSAAPRAPRSGRCRRSMRRATGCSSRPARTPPSPRPGRPMRSSPSTSTPGRPPGCSRPRSSTSGT